MKIFILLSFLAVPALLPAASSAVEGTELPVVVFQPSHQKDTGENYNEAFTADAMVEYALHTPPYFNEHKVWSYFQPGLHHSDTGTNTLIARTSALEGTKQSGYAWELARADEFKPLVFIGVHNNSGTGRR